MNRQQVYNTVREHLVKQGTRCHTREGCLYRGPDGMKCAVGILIPDALYSADMEHTNVNDVIEDHPAVGEAIGVKGANDVTFLRALQSIHDSVDPSEWTEKLVLFAAGEGLVP